MREGVKSKLQRWTLCPNHWFITSMGNLGISSSALFKTVTRQDSTLDLLTL